MRRPLAWVALCLVIIAAVRLYTGGCRKPPAGSVSTEELVSGSQIIITGQVYQKDDESIYLKSVNLIAFNSLEFSATEHSAADVRQEIPIYENIKCELEGAEELRLGTRVTVRGTFTPFLRATNPGEFDAAEYYRTLGLGGRLRKAEALSAGREFWPLREGLYDLKLRFRQRLYSVFPEKEATVMCALLLGDKSELDEELEDLYKRNGILHILSISSLHITILGMSVYKLLRRLGLPIGAAACAGSAALLLYGGMTGFGISACRAIGMFLLRMLAELTGRTYDMLISLGVLAAVMVTANPFYLQHSGFLLSFTSVMGVGVVYQGFLPREKRPPTKKERWKALRESWKRSALAGLSITLTTLPVQLWFYYEVPVYSVLINLLVLPLMQPLLITGLVVMLIPFADPASLLDCLILKGYELLCRVFDGLPFPAWNPGRPGLWQIVLYYCVLFGAVLFCARSRRREEAVSEKAGPGKNVRKEERKEKRKGKASAVRLSLTASALLAAVLILGFRPPSGNRVTFLDVGQGDCILVQTASGENYLFDCGSSSRKSIGRYVLLPFLKYSGIHRLDAVLLSHPDEDHINGALELLRLAEGQNIELGQIVLPDTGEKEKEDFAKIIREAGDGGTDPVPVRFLAAGEGWRCRDAEFLCLHPEAGLRPESSNAGSLCVCVRFEGGASLLLTGDVEGAGEAALAEELARRNIGGVSVLKVAHHGSRYSTAESFLGQAEPALAVISCGRDNRYGHPHEELLERLGEAGCRVFRTDRDGAVMIGLKGKSLTISRWR